MLVSRDQSKKNLKFAGRMRTERLVQFTRNMKDTTGTIRWMLEGHIGSIDWEKRRWKIPASRSSRIISEQIQSMPLTRREWTVGVVGMVSKAKARAVIILRSRLKTRTELKKTRNNRHRTFYLFHQQTSHYSSIVGRVAARMRHAVDYGTASVRVCILWHNRPMQKWTLAVMSQTRQWQLFQADYHVSRHYNEECSRSDLLRRDNGETSRLPSTHFRASRSDIRWSGSNLSGTERSVHRKDLPLREDLADCLDLRHAVRSRLDPVEEF